MARLPGTTGEAAAPTEEQLRLRLQGLQHQVARGRTWMRRLAVLAILLLLLLLLLLLGLYLYHVLQYASLEEIEITGAPSRPETANIRYVPSSSGKVEFIRRSFDQTETVTEHAYLGNAPAERQRTFYWTGETAEGYSLTARYRRGLFLVEKHWSPPRQ